MIDKTNHKHLRVLRALRAFVVQSYPAFRNPGIYIGVVITALLVVAAYQARPSYEIVFGSPTDGPLLTGFNTRERMQGDNPLVFRWTTGDSHIILAGVGRQDLDVTLTLSGNRPTGQSPADLTVEAAGRQLLHTNPSPDLVDYRFTVPRELVKAGTLDLHLTSNTFTPPNDPNPRPLGVIMAKLRAVPGAHVDGFVEPPIDVFVSLVGAAALLGVTLALVGWGFRGVTLGVCLLGGFAAWLLVVDRLWLTSGGWYSVWPQTLFAGAAFTLLVYLFGRTLFRARRVAWGGWERRLLLTLAFVVFVIRLAGQMHPQIFIVDLEFHVHRFEVVQSGTLLFTIKSAEWGNYPTFYLPTTYLFMLPLQWLLNDMSLVIKLFMVSISTLGALLVYYIARISLRDGRAGLLGAALYLTMPISVLLFSWGILTNVFGEFFALCVFALLATIGPGLSWRPPAFWILLVALLLALLSHPGVVQLTGGAVFVVCTMWLLARRRLGEAKGAAWAFAALLLSSGIAYLIYYRHFLPDMIKTFGEIRQARAQAVGSSGLHIRVSGAVADKSLGLVFREVDNWRDWFLGGLQGFWHEARAYYRAWPLAGAVLGYLAVWPRAALAGSGAGRGGSRLALTAVGWTLSALVFALAGWLLNVYVRYALFLLPVAALGSGVLLSRVWSRGRFGRWLTLLVALFFALQALALWQYRINYGLK